MIQIASPDIQIHVTPLEHLVYDGSTLLTEFDDSRQERVRLKFSPCQAVKITTIDCFDMRLLLINGELHRTVLEVGNSEWIAALKAELYQNDHQARFMEQAHHFVLPFQDNIVEVIAWGFIRL